MKLRPFGTLGLSPREMEHKIHFQDLVIGGSARRPAPRPRKQPDNLLPANLPPIGGTLEQIAIYIGVSENKYVELVRRGLMPPPKIIDGRRVHDFEAARAAFKRLTTTNGVGTPIAGGYYRDRTWEDIDNAT